MDEDHKFSKLVVMNLHVCILVVDDDGKISKLLWWIKMYDMLTTKMNVRSIMIMIMRVINCVFYMVFYWSKIYAKCRENVCFSSFSSSCLKNHELTIYRKQVKRFFQTMFQNHVLNILLYLSLVTSRSSNVNYNIYDISYKIYDKYINQISFYICV